MAKGLQSETGSKIPSRPQTTQAQTPVRVPPRLVTVMAPGSLRAAETLEAVGSTKMVIKSPMEVLTRIVFKVMLIPLALVPLVMPGMTSN